MATHASILAWKIPQIEELSGLQSTGCRESDMTKEIQFYVPTYQTLKKRCVCVCVCVCVLVTLSWYHQLNRHEFEQILGDSEGQGSLACCSPWDCKQLDMVE